MYMTPTFAFADIEQLVTEDFRIDSGRLDKVRQVLQNFVGTHNFHNFTSGVKYHERCANRYIIKWDVSEPFLREGMEFVTLRVKGQSFMLHQIRKMVGITVAIMRGYCGEDLIEKAYGPGHIDIPRTPGLGLVLEELHFSYYNKKWGSDGIHDKIEWEPIREAQAKFKEEKIISDIVAQEKVDKVTFKWLRRTNQMMDWGTGRNKNLPEWWITFLPFRKDYECEKRIVPFSEFESRPWYIRKQ